MFVYSFRSRVGMTPVNRLANGAHFTLRLRFHSIDVNRRTAINGADLS